MAKNEIFTNFNSNKCFTKTIENYFCFAMILNAMQSIQQNVIKIMDTFSKNDIKNEIVVIIVL
jgi:hypothetical protein